ncbi:MAG TPA: hypothetical protein VF837_02135, partial [Patescibacteria group bacterium]
GCAYGSCPSGAHSTGSCSGSYYMVCCEWNATPTPTPTPQPTPRPTATATPRPTSTPALPANCPSGRSCGANPSGCSNCTQPGTTNVTCCCGAGQTIVNNRCTTPGTPTPTPPNYTPTPTLTPTVTQRCTSGVCNGCIPGRDLCCSSTGSNNPPFDKTCLSNCTCPAPVATPTPTPTSSPATCASKGGTCHYTQCSTGYSPVPGTTGTTDCGNMYMQCCKVSGTTTPTPTPTAPPAGTCSLGTDCSKYASMPAGCSRCDCGCKWIISGSCKASGSGPNCNDVCAGQCATPTTKPTPTNPPPGNVCDAAHRDAPFSNSLTFGKAGTVYVFTRNTSGTITLSGPKTVTINSSNSGAAVQQPTTFTVNAGETYNLTVKLSNESGNAYGWRPTKAANTCGPTNAVCGGNVDITPLVNLATANSDVSNVLANGYAANTQCWGDQALGDQTQDFDYNDFSIIFGYLKEVVTPTPTPTIVPGPQCVSAKVYALNTSGQWAEVANPSTLTSGTKVRFGAIGSTTTVKRARFNINSAGWQASESKMVVGNSTVFYFEYTLKAGSYSIESEIQ